MFKYLLVILLAAALIVPVATKAATTAEIQIQIQAIMAQIQAIQQQIIQMRGDGQNFQAAIVNNVLPASSDIVIDNGQSGTSSTGTWCVSGSSGFYGTNSLYSCGSALDTYRWSPSLPGTTYDVYEVLMWWTSHVNRSTNVPIKILANVGGIQTSSTKYVNEQTDGGKWNSLGTFLLGSGSYVETNDSNGQAAADAVKFVKVVSQPTPTPAPTILLSASPLSITSGQSSTLSWSSTNATSCTASGAWSGTQSTSGSQVVIPAITSTYAITCTGSGGSATQSATVTVSAPPPPPPPSTSDIIIDNDTTGTSSTGTWCVSGSSGFYGTNSLYSCGSALDTYRWSPSLPGTTYDVYEVLMWWTSHVNRSTNVPIKILANVGGIQTSSTKYVNEQTDGGKWNSLGTFLLGSGSYVETNDSNGQAAADAVKFVKVVGSATTTSSSVLNASDLTSDFEMGSGFNFIDSAPNTIQIDAELENGKTYTHTPYFKIQQDALGKNPIFKIRSGWGGYHSYLYNPTGTPDTPNASWVYSYDNINWVRFPVGSTHYDLASDATTMQSPVFAQNTVYISPLIPYGYTTDFMTDKARWVANPNVTLSTLGTSVEGRPIELFTITNVSSSVPEASKKVYFIIRSGHPIEQHTSWRLRGMIDWALSSDPEAIRFRDNAILKATFSANVDGWVSGSFRTNAHGQDMNRDYEYTGANSALEEPETYAIHRAIEQYMATNHIDFFMDMHDSSSPSGGEQLYRAYSMPNSTSLTQLMTIINGLDTSNLINDGFNSYNYGITTYTDGVYGQYASRGVRSFMTEGGASFHQNGSYVTKASAQEVGKIFIKAFFKWLVP